MTLHPSSSSAQQAAEVVMLATASQHFGVALRSQRVRINGASIDVDGASEDGRVLVEVTAQVGTPKPAQAHKLATDILKLGWARQATEADRCAIVTWSDEVYAYSHRPGAWLTAARLAQNVEVLLVDRDEKAYAAVLDARKGQDFYPRVS